MKEIITQDLKEYLMKILIKSILTILLIGCIARMPYGYYQFIRIFGCIGFSYLAYIEFEENKIVTFILCVAAAILFNPIAKIYLERKLWNKIDIVVAILLVIWIIIDAILLLKKQEFHI